MRVSVELLRFIGLSGVMKSNSLFALKINLNIHARLCINVYRSLWMDASNLRQPLIHTLRETVTQYRNFLNWRKTFHLTCGSCFHPTHFAEQKKIHDKTEREEHLRVERYKEPLPSIGKSICWDKREPNYVWRFR